MGENKTKSSNRVWVRRKKNEKKKIGKKIQFVFNFFVFFTKKIFFTRNFRGFLLNKNMEFSKWSYETILYLN